MSSPHLDHRRALASTLVALMASLSLAACGSIEETEEDTETTAQRMCGAPVDEPEMALLRELSFVREQEDGVSKGADLDGRVSDSSDDAGCGHADFVAPDGAEGIDNQLAVLLPAIDASTGGQEALESAVQRTINVGSVLLMIRVDRTVDPGADQCVQVDLLRAKGEPTIGNLGLIEPGQTFERDDEAPSSTTLGATIEDGVVTAGPLTLEIPMQISTFDLLLTIRDATLTFEIAEDGSMQGTIAGAIVVDEILELLDTIADGTALLDIIRRVVKQAADLERDPETGRCRRLSVALEFEATPAFFFEGEDIDPEQTAEALIAEQSGAPGDDAR